MMTDHNGSTPQRKEDEQHNTNMYNYQFEKDTSGWGCGCFRFFCFEGDDRYRWTQLQEGEHNKEKDDDTWVIKKMKAAKEFSEVVAGPKWKNFVRKTGKLWNTQKSRMAECRQYDPQSYALNFDDGTFSNSHQHDTEDYLLAGFSAKFAPPAVASTQQQLPLQSL